MDLLCILLQTICTLVGLFFYFFFGPYIINKSHFALPHSLLPPSFLLLSLGPFCSIFPYWSPVLCRQKGNFTFLLLYFVGFSCIFMFNFVLYNQLWWGNFVFQFNFRGDFNGPFCTFVQFPNDMNHIGHLSLNRFQFHVFFFGCFLVGLDIGLWLLRKDLKPPRVNLARL